MFQFEMFLRNDYVRIAIFPGITSFITSLYLKCLMQATAFLLTVKSVLEILPSKAGCKILFFGEKHFINPFFKILVITQSTVLYTAFIYQVCYNNFMF